MNVLLIGYGAISQEVLKHISAHEPARITGVLVRAARLDEVRAALPDDIEVVADLDDLRAVPDLAAECAGHQAVAQHGPEILRRGIDLVVISIGSLSDRALYDALSQAAIDGRAKLLLPAGAVAGGGRAGRRPGRRADPGDLYVAQAARRLERHAGGKGT